jgi:UDP-N-acetylmuramate--alanine ligase
LAAFLAAKGYTVWGSDRAFDKQPGHPAREPLERSGVRIVPQDGRGLDESFDLAVFSTAVEPDRPEAVRAKELRIPTLTRPELLARLMRAHRSIAVAGTSGKSTVSGLMAFLMERLGMGPNFLGGGRVKQLMEGGTPGNVLAGPSDFLVAEACESDGSIARFHPEHTLFLNLALDHHSVEHTAGLFRTLIANTGGTVLYNADDRALAALMPSGSVSFGIQEDARHQGRNVQLSPLGSTFRLHGHAFELGLPGLHNVLNALAALAMLAELGASLPDARPHLAEFQGLVRRFDIKLNDARGLVVDDYAHNPHKIEALMASTRDASPSACYVFQPHGFGPTRLMKEGYVRTFSRHLRRTDHLLILPIFFSGGTVSRDISSADLAEAVRAAGAPTQAVEDREDAVRIALEHHACVVFGARDETLSTLAEDIARTFERRGAWRETPCST